MKVMYHLSGCLRQRSFWISLIRSVANALLVMCMVNNATQRMKLAAAFSTTRTSFRKNYISAQIRVSAATAAAPKQTIPDSCDIAIIGAGIGGLSCAAILSARYKLNVQVFEAHNHAGGCAHSFAIKSPTSQCTYEFDSGPTIILGCSNAPFNPLQQVLQAVGADTAVDWLTYDSWGMCTEGNENWCFQLGERSFQDGPLRRFGGSNAVREFDALRAACLPLCAGAAGIPTMALRADAFKLLPLLPHLQSLQQVIPYSDALEGTFAPLLQAHVTDPWLRSWLDALAFSLSGLPAAQTGAAAMAYTLFDLHRSGAMLDYPRGGVGTIAAALCDAITGTTSSSTAATSSTTTATDTDTSNTASAVSATIASTAATASTTSSTDATATTNAATFTTTATTTSQLNAAAIINSNAVSTATGSQVHLSQPVKAIEVDDTGAAVGVLLQSGKRVRARRGVICNADIWSLQKLLDNSNCSTSSYGDSSSSKNSNRSGNKSGSGKSSSSSSSDSSSINRGSSSSDSRFTAEQRAFLSDCSAKEKTKSFLHLYIGLDVSGISPQQRSSWLPHYTVMQQGLHSPFDPCADRNMVAVSVPSVLDNSLVTAVDGSKDSSRIVVHAYAAGNEPFEKWQHFADDDDCSGSSYSNSSSSGSSYSSSGSYSSSYRRSAAYAAAKEESTAFLWCSIARALGLSESELRSRADVALTGSPLTHQRFLRRSSGSYGAAWGSMRSGPLTPFSRLLLCGDSVFPGIGIPAVALSGANAANTIVGVVPHLLDRIKG